MINASKYLKKICVNASSEYDVVIGNGAIDLAGELISALGGGSGSGNAFCGCPGCGKASKLLLVSDDTVYSLYGEKAAETLKKAGFELSEFVFPHGESSKNLDTYAGILSRALESGLTRNDMFVALGGGVTGDLAGFAAATFKRGIRFVQIPTTLLSAVDASVGGKTGIDLDGGKNQVGAFHQPSLVLCDPELLETLPEDQFRSGLAEVIKTAMIADEALFETLARYKDLQEFRADKEGLIKVTGRCVEIKRDIVLADEFDRGERMLLNFGHPVGHGIEAKSGFAMLHGFAVAAGMAVAARAACNRNYCPDAVPAALETVLEKFGLPADTEYGADDILPFIYGDKKAAGKLINLVVPRSIGKCEITPLPLSGLEEFLYDGGLR